MAKYKVIATAPVTCYGYGLNFVNGIAETDDKDLAEYLKNKGYTIEEQPTKPAAKKPTK